MRRFYVFNAGCVRRGLDAMRVQKYLADNGWEATTRLRRAELIVIATCGVVRANELRSLDAIAKAARRASPSAAIVVSGCLPKINDGAIRELGDFIFVPSGELDRLDEVVHPRIPMCRVETPDSVRDAPQINNYLVARSFCRKSRLYKKMFDAFYMNPTFLSVSVGLGRLVGRVRRLVPGAAAGRIAAYYNIRILSGCRSACAFCATQFATGELRSRSQEEILEDFKRGLDRGYRYFQLISEDTGCYGLDIGTNLPELLRRIFGIEGDYQIIIIDCHPRWLVEFRNELVPVIVENQDRIKEMFVPVQSGSDCILAQMRRDYTVAEIRVVLKEIRERAPGVALRTSLLVGFPGETEEDFDATKQLIQEIDFAEVTVNRYEDRPGTGSSRMNGKVDQEVIECRARFLVERMKCRLLS